MTEPELVILDSDSETESDSVSECDGSTRTRTRTKSAAARKSKSGGKGKRTAEHRRIGFDRGWLKEYDWLKYEDGMIFPPMNHDVLSIFNLLNLSFLFVNSNSLTKLNIVNFFLHSMITISGLASSGTLLMLVFWSGWKIEIPSLILV